LYKRFSGIISGELLYLYFLFEWAMWETSSDVLNMSLAIGVGAVCFLLVFVLFYLILILRDLSYTSKHVRDTAEAVQNYLRAPVRVAMDIYRGIRDVMGWATGGKKGKK